MDAQDTPCHVDVACDRLILKVSLEHADEAARSAPSTLSQHFLEPHLPVSTPPANAPASAAATRPGAAARTPLERVEAALGALEAVLDARLDREADYAEADAEVQRMNVDRARLAQELDTAEARAERLAEVNREVSRRLVAAMETIRAVIDR
jgi:hypothetical protein